MLKITGLKEKLISSAIKVLGDSGYSYPLITPDDTESIAWNNTQKALRSVVEVVAGLAKNFKIAAAKVTECPEMHAVAIMIVYQLVSRSTREYPLCMDFLHTCFT